MNGGGGSTGGELPADQRPLDQRPLDEHLVDEHLVDEHCRRAPAEPLRRYVAWYTGYRQPGDGRAGTEQAGTSKQEGAVMEQGTPEPQVWPTLRARDARALIRFLVDAFGFEETVVYGDGDRVDHAQLSWPEGGGIMLGSVREGESSATSAGAFGAYVVTAEPDTLYRRAKAAGAEITSEPHDTDYGSRDFAARDPEGNRWSFGTYRGEPRKA